MTLAWMVSFAWRFLVNQATFWTRNALGNGRFFFIVSWFTSGFMMPLRFFPDWFVTLCRFTPFPHTMNTVVGVYLGLLTGPDQVKALLAQALWTSTLVIAGQVLLRAGQRQLVILGG